MNDHPADWPAHVAARLLEPSHFRLAPGLGLVFDQGTCTLPWEIFQGRLLDEAQTRQQRTFQTWQVLLDRGTSVDPLLSLLFDPETGELHVCRSIEGYVWEGYNAGGNVYESRERRKWLRELIATFVPDTFTTFEELLDEVEHALHRAVVGVRLPLAPTETPLPPFSFGEVLYCAPGEEPRKVEFDLRGGWYDSPPFDDCNTLREIFRKVSLSPWTAFADNVLDCLADPGNFPGEVIDFESWLLRLVGRHLTAYDLVTFHHRGANYPDALLIDLVLGDFLERIEGLPDLVRGESGRLRRRALRQAYVLRRQYEGHPVPDQPTSPGEHMRVFPAGVERVPEEQILQPARRSKRLFADDPLRERLGPVGREALAQSLRDLEHPAERQELGAAVYLERHFSGAKPPVAPDGTPLFASLAYSRFIAWQRLRLLGKDLAMDEAEVARLGDLLGLPGLPLDRIGPPIRPGTLALADAGRTASDFLYRRTLSSSVLPLLEWFDFTPLGADFEQLLRTGVLLTRALRGPGLIVHDAEWRARLELEPILDQGYLSRRGLELPAGGLRVTSREGHPTEIHLRCRWV